MANSDLDTQSSRGDPPEAYKKVRFLQTHDVPRKLLGHASSFSDFARRLPVKREVFRDQLTRSVLPTETQSLLATKLLFRVDWPEWSDGTAVEFESRYLKEHKRTPTVSTDVRTRKRPSQGSAEAQNKRSCRD